MIVAIVVEEDLEAVDVLFTVNGASVLVSDEGIGVIDDAEVDNMDVAGS